MSYRNPVFKPQDSKHRKVSIPTPHDGVLGRDTNSVLAGLNPAQRDAVTHPATVLQILAPPGSGKTKTLTSRVAYLLSGPHDMKPQNIVVATFTVKAAKEMKTRLSAMVGAGIESKLVMGTFHSIARRYLKSYGYLIGLRDDWGIADSSDSTAICKRIVKRRNLPLDGSKVKSRISLHKSRNELPCIESAAKAPPSTFMLSPPKKGKDMSHEEFAMLYEDYQAALDNSNLLDYDDLLIRCLQLLKAHPKCVDNVEAVLIDEFQDTNFVQFELMRALSVKNQFITIVGDPDQSIYGFRAAEIKNLKRMRAAYPTCIETVLQQNYRSSANILLAASEVIKQDDGRDDKPLVPTHMVGPRPVLRRVPTPATEASWIIGEIKRMRALTGGMIRLDGIAILVRMASLTRLIEQALVREGVGYKMVGGRRFWDRQEVKTVLDYLRVLQNPANNDALVRVINVPPRKIGEKTVKALLDVSEKNKRPLWDIVSKAVRGDIAWPSGVKILKPAERSLGEFYGLMTIAMEELNGQNRSFPDLVQGLLKRLKYYDYLQDEQREDSDSQTRLENVKELLQQVREADTTEETVDEEVLPDIEGLGQRDAHSGPKAALERFLSNVALFSDLKEREDADVGQDDHHSHAGQVTISTIHAAKGLEWPVVFIPATFDGSIPHSLSEDVDEERRLLYVAMTRAQGLLYMSCPFKGTNGDRTTLSQFLSPSSMTRFLGARAPELGYSAVQDLSGILRSKCPSADQIEDCFAQSGVESYFDDQISDKDPEAAGAAEDVVDEDEFGRSVKRRRFNSLDTSHFARDTSEGILKSKMTKVEKLNSGFRPASAHMAALKSQGDIACEAEKAVPTRKRPLEKTARSVLSTTTASDGNSRPSIIPSKPKAKPGKQSTANQSRMTTFFAKAAPPPPPASATDVVRTLANSEQTLHQQVSALPPPRIPKKRDGPILLSSSPTRPSRSEERDPVKIAVNAASGSKKTLGIRRSMNGWANRNEKR